MKDGLRLFITVCIFICPPLVTILLVKAEIGRRLFALIMSCSVGIQFFLISVMYARHGQLIIGGMLFAFALIGGYPTAYLLYPSTVEKIKNYQRNK
jgi:hypothetical protein